MLPDLTLTAVVSGTAVTLNAVTRPAVLIFHGQKTAQAAIEVNRVVRAAIPSADEVFIASVIDLRQFPAMFHGMVRPEIEKKYQQAAAELPPGADPARLIVLLPDWDGAAHNACGVAPANDKATVLIAAADGRIIARLTEANPGATVLARLQAE